jgi:hypothetical protein
MMEVLMGQRRKWNWMTLTNWLLSDPWQMDIGIQ